MEWVICPCCSEVLPVDGPGGVLVHLIAFHAKSDIARRVMAELSRLPLPESAR